MIENATAFILAPTVTKNSEGTVVKTYTDPAVEEKRVDVQPYTLSQAEMLEYGISNRTADTKKMFFDASANIAYERRVWVVSDFDTEVSLYEVRGVNHWPSHGEAILVPIQGMTRFILDLDSAPLSGMTYLWNDYAVWNDDGYWKD